MLSHQGRYFHLARAGFFSEGAGTKKSSGGRRDKDASVESLALCTRSASARNAKAPASCTRSAAVKPEDCKEVARNGDPKCSTRAGALSLRLVPTVTIPFRRADYNDAIFVPGRR